MRSLRVTIFGRQTRIFNHRGLRNISLQYNRFESGSLQRRVFCEPGLADLLGFSARTCFPPEEKAARTRADFARIPGVFRGTDGSNPAPSSSQSVSAVNREAIGEKPRT